MNDKQKKQEPAVISEDNDFNKNHYMLKAYVGIFLRGVAMGAADVVPGVSGGTVAFITGIYERLLNALIACNISSLLILKREGIVQFWRAIDGTFLSLLLAGIFCSVISLANVLSTLLETHPHLLWSFFFGLIAASALVLLRQIEQWHWLRYFQTLAGGAIALSVAYISPVQVEATTMVIFCSGMLAICAMLLPGISGSFILLLLGMYSQVIYALKTIDLSFIFIFAAGAVAGIMSFSRLLTWLYHSYREFTLALLTGFLMGSIILVWPWQHALEVFVDRYGKERTLVSENLWPLEYEKILSQDSQWLLCVGLMVLAASLVLIMERQFRSLSSD